MGDGHSALAFQQFMCYDLSEFAPSFPSLLHHSLSVCTSPLTVELDTWRGNSISISSLLAIAVLWLLQAMQSNELVSAPSSSLAPICLKWRLAGNGGLAVPPRTLGPSRQVWLQSVPGRDNYRFVARFSALEAAAQG